MAERRMTHIRIAAKTKDGGDRPEWLKVIHEANEIEPKFFGRPTEMGSWWAGGSVEEYEHARVLHRGDGTVSIVGKTDHGSMILKQAANHMGIHCI